MGKKSQTVPYKVRYKLNPGSTFDNKIDKGMYHVLNAIHGGSHQGQLATQDFSRNRSTLQKVLTTLSNIGGLGLFGDGGSSNLPLYSIREHDES